jgi:hypothetical protein
MTKLIIAVSVLCLLIVGIVGGIFLNQATFSGLLCFFGWSPACIGLGMALAGLKFSVSVQPKEAVIAKSTESAKEIRQRVSKVSE